MTEAEQLQRNIEIVELQIENKQRELGSIKASIELYQQKIETMTRWIGQRNETVKTLELQRDLLKADLEKELTKETT